MDNEFIGAIKIKDGLFIGDEYAAQVYFLPFTFSFTPSWTYLTLFLYRTWSLLSLIKLLTLSTVLEDNWLTTGSP